MPTEKESHNFASHWRFPYFFSDNDNSAPDGGTKQGINFRGIWHWDKDLLIYYGDRNNPDSGAFVNCWCSRWSVENYSITIETWLKKDDLQKIRDSITPGACKEMWSIMGLPKFYDTTFQSKNTIKLVPNLYKKKVIGEEPENATIGSNLPYMRREVTCYPVNITTSPVESDKLWQFLKIEFKTSGVSEL